MATAPTTARAATRGLILRDSATFLALCGVSVVLFLITLFVFRSFEAHRETLGERWAQRGRAALAGNRPAEAVTALRTALSYKDALPEQLLLAEALAGAGHTEEAMNYFLTLRESRPGDGFINLQLARLNRKEGDTDQAVDFYRASIFGDWQGDGAQRRRDVRLELADFLAAQGNTSGARDELLVAAGNAPESTTTDVLFGDRLNRVGASTDALQFYTRALESRPHQRDTLAKAGRLAYALGNYGEAARLLGSALDEHTGPPFSSTETHQLQTLASNARRLPELSLSRELPATERADHLLLAARVAQARLNACLASPPPGPAAAAQPAGPATQPQTPPQAPPQPVLQILRSRWSVAAPQLKKRTLERDADLEDNVTELINDTETQTAAQPAPLCGPPEGDDALLLLLASSPNAPH